MIAEAMLSRLVLVLIHSLWQGVVCAGLLFLVLRSLPAGRTTFRYLAGICLLGTVLLSMIATWSVLEKQQPVPSIKASTAINQLSRENLTTKSGVEYEPVQTQVHSTVKMQSPWTTWVGMIWGVGATLMLFRVGFFLTRSRRLIANGTPLTDQELHSLIDNYRTILGIRQNIRVLVYEELHVPAVVGIFWPTLLIPASVLSGVPIIQLQVIIAHELAHIRRCDYLINLLQLLIESVLFFNPAVWWISKQIRTEREACCDALAVRISGEPMDVAQTLVDYAERLGGCHKVPASVQAMGRNATSLFERVKRIALPESSPQIRIPWVSFVVLLVMLVAVVWGIEKGTHLVASKFLATPEHLDQIEDLVEHHAPYGPFDSATTISEDEKVKLIVHVKTDDGSPLPKGLHVHATSHRKGSSAGYSLVKKEDHYEYKVKPGSIFVNVSAEGFAPAISKMFTVTSGVQPNPVKMVLRQGFSARVRIVDSQGKPVPDATVNGLYMNEFKNGSQSFHGKSGASNHAGEVVWDHCLDHSMQVSVQLPGYQFERRTLDLKADQTADYIVYPGRKTPGRVVSHLGQPVAGAEVSLLRQHGNFSLSHTPFERYGAGPPVLETTDSKGNFELNQLRDDSEYSLLITAVGHQPQIINKVIAGKDLKVTLGPERYIQGTITGSLDKLKTQYRSKKKVLTFQNSMRLGNSHSYNYYRDVVVEVKDGVGAFYITNLFQGTIRLHAPGKELLLDPQPAIENLVIDLNEIENQPQHPTRKVVLDINIPKGSAAPRGQLRVDYIRPEHPNSYYPKWIDITNGQVALEVPVPTRLRYETGKMIGYWVKETSNIEISAGNKPFSIDVTAHPAGTVYGRLLNADGSPCDNSTNISVIVVEKPKELGNSSYHPRNNDGENGKYLISQFPMGGAYRLVASRKSARVVSEEIRFRADRPIQQIDLKFSRGVDVQGKVVDPKGNPIPAAEVSLDWSSPYSHGFGGESIKTDRKGQFRMENVNPGLPGKYTLRIDPVASFQGRSIDLKPDSQSNVITLRRGKITSGFLIDTESNDPIPNATIELSPKEYDKANYRGTIYATTDGKGRFQSFQLEPILYRVQIRGLLHADATYTSLTGGGFRVSGPSFWEITGGQTSIEIQAKPRPGS